MSKRGNVKQALFKKPLGQRPQVSTLFHWEI
jgi:hypothetical protein